jgi:alpha-mannosidase
MTTLHFVPHTHWDREWYLPYQEFRIKLVHLVDALLDLLDADPGYLHFTLDGQTSVVDDYLEVRPGRREQLERLVREGRLLVGPWTVLPDEFLVSPESLVRNLQHGARSAAALGRRMEVGYVPDPFGHIGQLPQILRGFGIEAAAFRRGLGDDPVELLWESRDGSRVLVSYLRDGYDNAARMPVNPESFARVARALDDSLAKHSAVSHRLMLNGTDHHEPQPELPVLLAQDEDWLHSTLPAYLEAVRDEVEARGIELPVIRGELRDPQRHHLLPGVLSSRTWIKLRNDACERALERWAEPFSTWAERLCGAQPDHRVWTGSLATPRIRDPQDLLDRAWRLLLECHPHDSICGCSVDPVHDEMRARFDQSEQIAEEITRQSLTALALEIDTSGLDAEQVLVVFNASATPGPGVAHATLELGGALGLGEFEIVDGTGRVLPCKELDRRQRELAKTVLEPGAVRSLARSVENGRILGLAIESVAIERQGRELSIELIVSEGGTPNPDATRTHVEQLRAELDRGGLERVRVHSRFAPQVDVEVAVPDLPSHGHVALGVRTARDAQPAWSSELFELDSDAKGRLSLLDKRSGRRFDGLLALRDRGERGDSYTTDPLDDAVEELREVRVDRSEAGLEIRGVLTVPGRLAPDRARRVGETVDLPVCIKAALAPAVPRVDIEVEIENRAEDHRLELLFPSGASCERAAYDGHFEVVERPTAIDPGGEDWAEQPREELPMRAFVEAGELLVATRGLREASVSPDGVIAVTLLRCFGWLSRDDLRTRAGGAGPQETTPGGQVPGVERFELSIVPVNGDPVAARAQADAFQVPPRGAGTGIHAGSLPQRASLLETAPAEFQLTAVVRGRDGASTIARGVWQGAGPGVATLRPLVAASRAERVRLDETPIAEVESEDGTVSLELRPGEIASVRFAD